MSPLLATLEESALQLGLGGIALGILGWFMKTIVTKGVIPFVAGTLQAQERLVGSVQKIGNSNEETSKAVQAMSQLLSQVLESQRTLCKAEEVRGGHGKVRHPEG